MRNPALLGRRFPLLLENKASKSPHLHRAASLGCVEHAYEVVSSVSETPCILLTSKNRKITVKNLQEPQEN